MLNPNVHTGTTVSNGIVALTNRIAAIPAFAITNNNNSRLHKTGLFIYAKAHAYIITAKQLQVSVYCYASISLLRNAANFCFKMLKKLN